MHKNKHLNKNVFIQLFKITSLKVFKVCSSSSTASDATSVVTSGVNFADLFTEDRQILRKFDQCNDDGTSKENNRGPKEGL